MDGGRTDRCVSRNSYIDLGKDSSFEACRSQKEETWVKHRIFVLCKKKASRYVTSEISIEEKRKKKFLTVTNATKRKFFGSFRGFFSYVDKNTKID